MVSDVRFPDEAAAIRARGGVIVEIRSHTRRPATVAGRDPLHELLTLFWTTMEPLTNCKRPPNNCCSNWCRNESNFLLHVYSGKYHGRS